MGSNILICAITPVEMHLVKVLIVHQVVIDFLGKVVVDALVSVISKEIRQNVPVVMRQNLELEPLILMVDLVLMVVTEVMGKVINNPELLVKLQTLELMVREVVLQTVEMEAMEVMPVILAPLPPCESHCIPCEAAKRTAHCAARSE